MRIYTLFAFLIITASILFSCYLLNTKYSIPAALAQDPCASPSPGGISFAEGLVTGKTFGTTPLTTGPCLQGEETGILLEQAKIRVDDYATLKSVYYDQSKLPGSASTPPVSGGLTFQLSSIPADVEAFTTTGQGQFIGLRSEVVSLSSTIGTSTYAYTMGGYDGSNSFSNVYKSSINISGDLGTFSTANQGQLPLKLAALAGTTITIGSSSYVYAVGGGGPVSTNYKSTINSTTGDLGAFSTASQAQLPLARRDASVKALTVGPSSYLYVLGGCVGTSCATAGNQRSTAYKAIINSSGNVAAFSTTSQTQLPVTLGKGNLQTASFGGTNYFYLIGGVGSDGARVSSIYKAALDSSGNAGTFSTANQGQLPIANSGFGASIFTIGPSSYIYVFGGSSSSSSTQSALYRATINPSTGDLGVFTTTNQAQVPANLTAFGTVSETLGSSSYLYLIGGFDGTNRVSTAYKSKVGGAPVITQIAPLGWWKFNGNANDSSGNGNNGTISGNAPFVTGKASQAISLNGNNQYVSLTNGASLKGLNGFTISAWVQPKALPASGNSYKIYDESVANDATKTRAAILVSNNTTGATGTKFVFAFRTGDGSSTLRTVPGTLTTPSINNWYHVVAVFDADSDNYKIYVNGVADGTSSITENPIANTNPNVVPKIGTRAAATAEFFNGYIDDVVTYSSALTTQNVQALYNSYASSSSGLNSKFPAYTPPGGTATEAYFNTGGAGAIVANALYDINGDLDINNTITATSPKTIVIFVDGNLNINSNLTYGDNDSGIVFVVEGDINIDPDVTQIDAVLISSGTICTAYTGSPCDLSESYIDTTNPLVVNGSLIALNPNAQIQFKRSLPDNSSEAAEKIYSQPKYLVILTGLFSKDLIAPF